MKLSGWLALLMVCGGCGSSPNTAYYALAAARGTMREAALGVVEVRRPGIAGYLDRAEILAQWDGHRLQLAPNACWGEPIASMVGRVLAEDLSERLHGTIVFSASSDLSLQAAGVVELAIRKFDLDAEGVVQLSALVSVRWQGGQAAQATRAVELRARPPTADTGAVVSTMSGLLGQLADEVASLLLASAPAPAPAQPQ